MDQEISPSPERNRFAGSIPPAGARQSTSSAVIAARVSDWAASHEMHDDALLLNIRSVIEGTLTEYFRFLTCDESVMVFNHDSSGGSAKVLILPASERYWGVAYKNEVSASDITSVTLGNLLDNARTRRNGETARSCPGWSFNRDDLPLDTFVRSKLCVPFGVKVMEYLHVMPPLPGQRIHAPVPLLEELASVCDDLPVIRARFAIERIAARCDPALGELINEDPGVRVREYNFAASAQNPNSRANRFRWARSFPALWGLRKEPRLRALIDGGQPFIKPAATLLDCSAAAIRKLRVIEHCVANRFLRNDLDQDADVQDLEDRNERPRFEGRPEWIGVLDVPLLLLDGLAGLSIDKLPPPESLSSMNTVLEGGTCGDAPARGVIGASFHAARLLTEEQHGVINPVFPTFRPLVASTKGKWVSVARQLNDITREDFLGIRDFVRMLGDTLVLPYLLRVNEVHDLAEVEKTLVSSAHGQMALLLASRWHLGKLMRHSIEWHRSFAMHVNETDDGWRDNYDWPAWFKPIKASNGVVIKPLCSAAALREEGALMHHCAGRYYRDCMKGLTQIFSLRTARGKRLSTLQLYAWKVRPKKFCFSIAQHRAAYNAHAPGEAEAAAGELLSALNQGELRYRVGPPAPRGPIHELHTLCGFDYRSDTAWGQATAAALPFLPSDLQRLGPMELAKRVITFKVKPRSEQPELCEPDDNHDDFEKRVLRWIS
jgi:hypothetical protein